MARWNPQQYMKFGTDRLRPALDLLAQIQLDAPRRIVDLGCGPGNVTALLKERWPGADVMGIDSSGDMLEKAQTDYPYITWQQADIANWEPEDKPDLIFSNACLHWLGDHEKLFPRLLHILNKGGVLAIQMPNNFAAPTHQLIRDVLGPEHPLAPGFPVHEPAAYYNWLSPLADVNLWETTYQHILEGENPVADWTKGAALRPVLDGLSVEEGKAFENAYRDKVLAAYPKSQDGKTIMPFRRFFLILNK